MVEGLEARDSYFRLNTDYCRQLPFYLKQKCTTALRIFTLGITADVVGEMVQMGESICLKTTVRLSLTMMFGTEYMRDPNVQDTKRLMSIGAATSFSVCLLQLIACIGNRITTPGVCAGCTRVIPKRPPSYLKQWYQGTCGLVMLSLAYLVLTTTSICYSNLP